MSTRPHNHERAVSPGGRPGIPLEAEPVLWLHPARVGAAAGGVQPVQRVPALEDEPALWLRLPAARAALPPSERVDAHGAIPVRTAARSAPPAGPALTLPATGIPRGWSAAAWLGALGWALRRRQASAPAGPTSSGDRLDAGSRRSVP